MAVGESPAVARHRLRLALREAREAKGLTQRQVARSLEWSMAKVNRIEGGEVTISTTDLQALLRLLDVTDTRLVESLTELARASRQRGWWDKPEYRSHLTPAMIQLLQFELNVIVIRSFQAKVVPGTLQTRAYAEAILAEPWSSALSDEDLATRLEIRLYRRDQLISHPDSPTYLLVLDESVLLREVGGAQVIADQLYDLLGLIRDGRVIVRVLPFTHPGSYAAFGSFILCGSADDNAMLLYRESHDMDEAVLDSATVHRHQDLFERIWSQSLDVEASIHLIEARAAAHRATADRLAPD